MNKKRHIAKITVFITSIFVIFMSVTYAFITQVLTGEKQVVINAGVLDLVLEEENEITISDALPMYDQVGMIQEDVFVFRLVNKTNNPTNYILKLSKIASDNELATSDVKYYLTKEGVGEPKLLSSLPLDGTVDSGTIAGNDTIDYTLRLWIDSTVTDQTTISGKSLSYMLKVDASQEIAKDTTSFIEVKLFADENLGNNCKTYDDGTDTFLVGQCSNNYVWYSGKLWRVVLKNNETGAVKMVTDNGISTLEYNVNNNTTFENSYMDQWLNQEFLPTLHDYQNYLVTDSEWDATLASNITPSRPDGTTIIERTVGLLNTYEFYTTYNNSDNLATPSTTYLHNKAGDTYGIYWWTLTPHSPSNLWAIHYDGYLNSYIPPCALSARPAVYLKANIQIVSGTGAMNNPYFLEGDEQETTNGTTLLSTRYSGEYVTFNNELYRIVGTEDELTKIVAVDRPSSLLSNVYDSSENKTVNFADATIKTDLENYYQSLLTSNQDAYNMIQPNTTWYLGTVGSQVNYKAGICKTVNDKISARDCERTDEMVKTNIGLPRAGEMFTSQITRGAKAGAWTLTPWNSSDMRNIWYDGNLVYVNLTNNSGARPSMYLKRNVVIASNNTGNGTYEYPYKIELNQ